jgi:hypothetical protein
MTFRCPRCSEPLIKSQAGRVKIRVPIIAVRADGGGLVFCETECRGCTTHPPRPRGFADEGLPAALIAEPTRSPNIRLTATRGSST